MRRANVSAGVPFLCALGAVAFYVAFAYAQNGEFGFPLDDAWIHQVYARNLGTRFEFSFFAGQPSAGSTSPLWAILLGPGYALYIDYRVWTLLLGIILLGASGWMTGRVMPHLTSDARLIRWAAPLFLVLEWHMVWAAASGMEILLFVFLSLALVAAFFEKRNALWLGLAAGLLTLARPEGIILAGLVGIGLVYRRFNARDAVSGVPRQSIFPVITFGSMFLLVLLPYAWFNLETSGTLLPNTFYAKTSEYAALTESSNFFARWMSLYRQPLIGAQLLLIPGLLYGAYILVRQRAWVLLLPALWILILPAFYAWRLPVEYQFGRYMMPIIPFVIVYGIAGTAQLLPKIRLRLLRRVWVITTGVLLFAFLFIGANAYAEAVGIVNCEMVAAARWTRANVPAGALIAAHDIGAQGYFDEHPILDMAGLVSPEVIPLIRDEARLKAWMQERGAQYAIFFPTWYPQLAGDGALREVFSTGCERTRQAGEENLGVFQLP